MRRMLGPLLEANVWGNMERMLGPMLVVWAASLHDVSNSPTLEASFEARQKNRQLADYLPTPTLEAGRSSFVPRLHDVSNASGVQHWKYLTYHVAMALDEATALRLTQTDLARDGAIRIECEHINANTNASPRLASCRCGGRLLLLIESHPLRGFSRAFLFAEHERV